MRTRLVVLLVLAHGFALADPPLGDAGESCRARADCRTDLHCIDALCTSVKPGVSTGLSLADGKAHPFMGWTLTGGFTIAAVTGNGPGVGGANGAFGTAFDVGMFVGMHQVTMTIGEGVFIGPAPLNGSPGTAQGGLDMALSYAYLLRLALWGGTRLYWPVRIGVGMLIIPGGLSLPGTSAFPGAPFLEVRADVTGLMIQAGHVFVDLHLPTFAYALTSSVNSNPQALAHLLDWQFGATVGFGF
jgi:hypothetical protein